MVAVVFEWLAWQFVGLLCWWVVLVVVCPNLWLGMWVGFMIGCVVRYGLYWAIDCAVYAFDNKSLIVSGGFSIHMFMIGCIIGSDLLPLIKYLIVVSSSLILGLF